MQFRVYLFGNRAALPLPITTAPALPGASLLLAKCLIIDADRGEFVSSGGSSDGAGERDRGQGP